MSFTIALLVHAILGGLCAYQGRGRLENRRELLGPPFLLASAVTALVGGPVCVVFFRFHPAWFFHYIFNPLDHAVFETWAFALSLVLMLVLGGAAAGGFLAVRYAIDRMHPPYCLAPVGGLAGVLLLFCAVFFHRAFQVGTLEQFGAEGLQPIQLHAVGGLSMLPLVASAVAVVLCGRWFKVDNSPSIPPR